jgi:hypothetical protein
VSSRVKGPSGHSSISIFFVTVQGEVTDQARVNLSLGQSRVTCTARPLCAGQVRAVLASTDCFFLAPGQAMEASGMDSIARGGRRRSHATRATYRQLSGDVTLNLNRLRRSARLQLHAALASALVRIHFEAGVLYCAPPTSLVGPVASRRRRSCHGTARHGGDKLGFFLETIPRSLKTKLQLFRPCSAHPHP